MKVERSFYGGQVGQTWKTLNFSQNHSALQSSIRLSLGGSKCQIMCSSNDFLPGVKGGLSFSFEHNSLYCKTWKLCAVW